VRVDGGSLNWCGEGRAQNKNELRAARGLNIELQRSLQEVCVAVTGHKVKFLAGAYGSYETRQIFKCVCVGGGHCNGGNKCAYFCLPVNRKP
jgi:hypothetical protein